MSKKYYWLGEGEPSHQDTFFVEALDDKLWSAGSAKQWDTCWHTGMPDSDVYKSLTPHQTINHIPGNNALTIKSHLYNTLVNARNLLKGSEAAKRYDFFPETFSMPDEYFTYQQKAMDEPEAMWIQKPRNLSRGRGIAVVKEPSCVPVDDEWIIQRYLDKPHLYDGHKYVLRCYVLITSIEPLCFYLYREGFCKLASERYSTTDLDNPYRHLTNPDINVENTKVETPVTFFSFAQYREWLSAEGCDDEALFAQLKDLIALTVIAAREKMREQTNRLTDTPQGCYELIGLDCTIDTELKPWILECNLSPSLSTYATNDEGGNREVAIKRQLVHDLVNILGLNHDEGLGRLSAKEKQEWQLSHCGGFECLFPLANAKNYLHCFPIPRFHDLATLPTDIHWQIDLAQRQAAHEDISFSDSLALVPNSEDSLIVPNDLASWIWLKNAEADTPEAIVQELVETLPQASGIDHEVFIKQLRIQVWDMLADWAQAGLFTRYHRQQEHNLLSDEHQIVSFCWGEERIQLRSRCPIACRYLAPLSLSVSPSDLADPLDQRHEDVAIDCEIVRATYGYLLLENGELIRANCTLADILPVIYEYHLTRRASNYKAIVINGFLSNIEGRNTLLLGDEPWLANDMAWQLQEYKQGKMLGSAVLLAQDNKQILTFGTPLLLSASLAKTILQERTHSTAIAVEKQQQIAYWHSAWSHLPEPCAAKVDTIIVLSQQEGIETDSLTQAKLLSKVWDKCYGRENISVSALAHWLEDIQGFTVAVNNKRDISREKRHKKNKNAAQSIINCLQSKTALNMECSQ